MLCKDFASLKLWGAIYMLCYGLVLFIASSAARYELAFRWGYDFAVIGFSATLSWKLSRLFRDNKFLRLITFLLGLGLISLGLFYLPWSLPTYYGDVRFGWTKHTVDTLNLIFRILLIIGGVCALFWFFSDLARRKKAERNR